MSPGQRTWNSPRMVSRSPSLMAACRLASCSLRSCRRAQKISCCSPCLGGFVAIKGMSCDTGNLGCACVAGRRKLLHDRAP